MITPVMKSKVDGTAPTITANYSMASSSSFSKISKRLEITESSFSPLGAHNTFIAQSSVLPTHRHDILGSRRPPPRPVDLPSLCRSYDISLLWNLELTAFTFDDAVHQKALPTGYPRDPTSPDSPWGTDERPLGRTILSRASPRSRRSLRF